MVINAGSVEVNGKAVNSLKYPLGFGDVIYFKQSNEHYRIGVGKKGAIAVEKESAEKAKEHIFKVIGKYLAKGNREMIRLYNGTVVPSVKDVRVNDSVRIKDGKIDGVIRLEKGARCLVIRGVHASESGTISDIRQGTALRGAIVEIESPEGKKQTLLDNVMAVGA